MATTNLKFHRILTSATSGTNFKVGEVYFVKNSDNTGKIYICTKQGTGMGTASSNATLEDYSVNTWRGIVDNLTSTSTTDSLSAAQGKALKDAAEALATTVSSNNNNALHKAGDETVTGTKTFTPQQIFNGGAKFKQGSSGYNNTGVVFTSGSRICENTGGDLGIYGANGIYIRPGSSTAASSYGVKITNTDISLTTSKSASLGTSSLFYNGVYSSSFVKESGTASQFLMANGTVKTLSTTPTASSTDPISSGAVKSAVDSLNTAISAKANDSAVVHIANPETITGLKTFSQGLAVTAVSGTTAPGTKLIYNSTTESLDFVFV